MKDYIFLSGEMVVPGFRSVEENCFHVGVENPHLHPSGYLPSIPHLL